MFCPKCGNPVTDGATFCPVCGASLIGAPGADPAQAYQQPVPQYQQPYQQPAQQAYYGGYNPGAAQQERLANMQEMERMHSYFSQKADEYNEYDLINYTLDEYDKRKPGLLVWGIILFVIGFIMLLAFAEDRSTARYIYVPIIWCIGSIGMILAFIFSTISRKKNKEAAMTRLVELADELHTHFVNFGYCPIGEEFTNPAILSKISENLRTGRANNITDAINIMFDDAHKSQMEWAAMETAHSARQAAAGARTAAVFAAANFFLR